MKEIISSSVRHIIGTLVGGYVTQGIITGDQAAQIENAVIALVTIGALVGWSAIEKKFLGKKSE